MCRTQMMLATYAVIAIFAATANAQTLLFDFEDGTVQGFGAKFSSDVSETFPIISICDSNRMEVLRNGDFQEADRGSGGDAPWMVLSAAANSPSDYLISYDWYVDTSLSPGSFGNFLQIGTYLNVDGGAYTQDFPVAGKDVELDAAQLASGQIFSGAVTEALTHKYGSLDSSFAAGSFLRFGLIINGDGERESVYFDNIRIAPVPEPSTIILLGLVFPGLGVLTHCRH